MRRPLRQSWPCPDHIIDYLENHASWSAQKAAVTLVEEVQSAQQLVFILTLSFKTERSFSHESHESSPLQRALLRGNNKIVARVWKGSARWWNLNTHDASSGASRGVVTIARSEIAGYRLARDAISNASIASSSNTAPSKDDRIIIPEVIYFSCDYRGNKANINGNNSGQEQNPWAVLTYVGEESCYFHNDDGNYSSSQSTSSWTCDEQYAKDMVKMRHEFGFDEPHPRWGRVKEDQALTYAMRVLDSVVLPIQSAFFASVNTGKPMNQKEDYYTKDLTILGKQGDKKPKPFRYQDMIVTYYDAAVKMADSIRKQDAIDRKIGTLLGALDICIERLHAEAKLSPVLSESGALPPSLCHMDLQPQNCILRRHKVELYDVNVVPSVSSVLDWEEACYADPRFEVLLMARKVCANREQADRLWEHYSCQLKERYNFVVGPIEPWLKLETVHSITTLLLQCMDLVGGGRNPWENKPDLMGKIEREFARLNVLGWDIEI